MKTVCSLLILCFSIPSFSGVQSVGKGGGFAEMQAYAIDRSLDQLISHCLKPQNYCALSPEETQIANELNRFLKQPDVDLIQINESCQAPFRHANEQGVVSLDACRLYSKDSSEMGPLPLSHQEIGQLVVSARILTVHPFIPDDALNVLVNKLMVSFQFEDHPVLVPMKAYHFLLHLWSLSTAATQSQLLTIETLHQSHDLTESLHSFLCQSNLQNLSFGEFQFFDSSFGVTGKSQIHWECGGQRLKANLYMDLYFQADNFEKASFSLYQKEEN